MQIACFELFLFPLEELHCGYGVQQGNILPALPYIPGRVVRGGLAGWALRNAKLRATDKLFRCLFQPVHHLSSPYKQKISFPWCTYRGYEPAPFSLFALKGTGLHPHSELVMQPEYYSDNLIDIDEIKRGLALDFLKRTQWPFQVDMSLKPLPALIGEYNWIIPPLSLLIDLRAHHLEEQGRVGKDGLYAEEVLPGTTISNPHNCYYQGNLYCQEESAIKEIFAPLVAPDYLDEKDREKLYDLKMLLQDPPPKHLLFLGRRRLPVVIIAREEKPAALPPISGAVEFTLTFVTDLVEEHPYPLTEDTLQRNFGISGLKKKRVFCRPGECYGYDVFAENKPLEPLVTLAAGSCGFFAGDISEEHWQRLQVASLLGTGQNTLDGFGRFRINWDIHELLTPEE